MGLLRVAIADDDVAILEDLKETLEGLGHAVVISACDGAALLQGCLKERPDLVISDLRMPILTGLQVARQLMVEQPLPFLMISAQALLDSESQGVHAQLIKPIEDEALLEAISLATRSFHEQHPGTGS
jgi:CheY-like chemotaxis protein